MRSKVHVRFGGGRLEKDCLGQYLADRLPYHSWFPWCKVLAAGPATDSWRSAKKEGI
jgi:hypothetical protein